MDNFIDDVIIYTSIFQEHSSMIREFLQRLRAANVTVKPSNCFIGYRTLECPGHKAGDEKLRPIYNYICLEPKVISNLLIYIPFKMTPWSLYSG